MFIIRFRHTHLCFSQWLLVILAMSGYVLRFGDAKQYNFCELARDLVQIYDINRTFLPSWICLIINESGSNTQTTRSNSDGSKSYGLFQLSDSDACGIEGPDGICKTLCSNFLNDDIDDDMECAAQIANTKGFDYWHRWRMYCRERSALENVNAMCPGFTFIRPTHSRLRTRIDYEALYDKIKFGSGSDVTEFLILDDNWLEDTHQLAINSSMAIKLNQHFIILFIAMLLKITCF